MIKIKKLLFITIVLTLTITNVSVVNAESELYLIVSPDEFENSLLGLIDLKSRQGFEIETAFLSETGETPTEIRDYIFSISPDYVLLIGDVDNGNLTMPAFLGELGQVTDFYYGAKEGEISQSIPVGRFPARSKNDLLRMIWTLKYARYPEKVFNHTAKLDESWRYFFYEQYLPEMDTLEGFTFYESCSGIVKEAITSGQEIWGNTGHGGPYSMRCFPREEIEKMNINSLIFPSGCNVGDFRYPVSYSEQLMLQGAIGVISASDLNLVPIYELWAKEFYKERLVADKTVGELMNHAKIEVGKTLTDEYKLWMAETYNLLGDPSLRFGEFIDFPKYKNYIPFIINN